MSVITHWLNVYFFIIVFIFSPGCKACPVTFGIVLFWIGTKGGGIALLVKMWATTILCHQGAANILAIEILVYICSSYEFQFNLQFSSISLVSVRLSVNESPYVLNFGMRRGQVIQDCLCVPVCQPKIRPFLRPAPPPLIHTPD